ncbi:maker733 [Drosophila busckii]|uniref:Maker733 n=1 Tax=Drosophila busckii TaxID=30019 RepID=A0A0M4EIH6_DROBS|nr:maker733 [Drosophila busckii]
MKIFAIFMLYALVALGYSQAQAQTKDQNGNPISDILKRIVDSGADLCFADEIKPSPAVQDMGAQFQEGLGKVQEFITKNFNTDQLNNFFKEVQTNSQKFVDQAKDAMEKMNEKKP